MQKLSIAIGVVALLSIIANFITENPYIGILSTLLIMALFAVNAYMAQNEKRKGAFLFYMAIVILGVFVLGMEISAL